MNGSWVLEDGDRHEEASEVSRQGRATESCCKEAEFLLPLSPVHKETVPEDWLSFFLMLCSLGKCGASLRVVCVCVCVSGEERGWRERKKTRQKYKWRLKGRGCDSKRGLRWKKKLRK